MKFSQIKIAAILMTLLTHIIAGDAYNYVDIGECMLPIDKKLVNKGNGNYDERDYVGSYVDPIGISIEKADKKAEVTAAKAKKMLHLNKRIIISGYTVFSNGKKINTNRLVYLKNHILLLANYPSNDLEYMLEYCKRTSKQ